MWPPGHLAVGYLAYTLYRQVREGQTPESAATVALAAGTQFPDIVDKPLSWTLAVLPTGRTLAHSVVTAAAVTVIVGRCARAVNRVAFGNAFTIGYGSHLLADLYAAVAAGDAETNWFLFWPIVSQEEYVTQPSFHVYAELVGMTSIVTLGYVVAFAVAVAALLYRTETTVRSIIAFVVAAAATPAGIILWSGVGSTWAAFELVLVVIAAAFGFGMARLVSPRSVVTIMAANKMVRGPSKGTDPTVGSWTALSAPSDFALLLPASLPPFSGLICLLKQVPSHQTSAAEEGARVVEPRVVEIRVFVDRGEYRYAGRGDRGTFHVRRTFPEQVEKVL